MIMSDAIFADMESGTAFYTYRLPGVVSHNTILSANEQQDFSSFFILFFFSFTDKILNS